MKTLNNQTLLYDEDCPLCQAYTSAFIKTGMLDENGRMPYSSLSETNIPYLDEKRAANEIALVDHANKTVTYGIDSLLKVLGNSIPLISTIGNIRFVKYLLKKLYSFISYNRKVIIPGRKKENGFACEPAFNVRYRFAFILFALIVTTLTLYNYSAIINFLPEGDIGREMVLAAGQILFQGIFLIKYDRQTILNYIGNLMTVSLAGSLLLLPMLFTNTIFYVPQYLLGGWFALTALLMFVEHYRRVKLLELPTVLCYTWAVYRILALIIILNL